MQVNTFFLLADDDHDDAELFNEALSTVNPSIKFHHVEDGQEVFQFLLNSKIKKPDVIFLDLNMPAMSGWQCLAKLKNDPLLKDIPVIMLSSQDKIEVAVNCMHHHAYDYVVKSETAFMRLKKIISNALHYQKIQKELLGL